MESKITQDEPLQVDREQRIADNSCISHLAFALMITSAMGMVAVSENQEEIRVKIVELVGLALGFGLGFVSKVKAAIELEKIAAGE